MQEKDRIPEDNALQLIPYVIFIFNPIRKNATFDEIEKIINDPSRVVLWAKNKKEAWENVLKDFEEGFKYDDCFSAYWFKPDYLKRNLYNPNFIKIFNGDKWNAESARYTSYLKEGTPENYDPFHELTKEEEEYYLNKINEITG